MKPTEDGRRYNAAHVLDGAMDIHTHETGSTVFQCLTLQLLWSRDLRASLLGYGVREFISYRRREAERQRRRFFSN